MSFGFGFGFPKNYVAALFSPAQLFTGTTQGVWYDPSDTTTLYRDAAGTLPVTAVEQPVGLMLDKSKGLVLGPELVTNGTFDTDTAWTKGTGWSITGGKANYATGGGAAILTQTNVFEVGKSYRVTFDVLDLSAAGVNVYSGATATPPTINIAATTNGTFTGIIQATSTTLAIRGSAAGVYAIDNISVRELPGNHAFNSSGNSANFPVLSARYNLLTKSEQFDDAVWTKTFGGTGSIPVVTPNAGIAPDGTNTADRIVFNKGSGATTADYSLIGQAGINAGSTCKGSVYVKSYTGSTQKVMIYVVHSASVQVSTLSVGSEWVQISATSSFSITAGGINIGTRGGAAFGGDDTLDLLVWGADLRVANDGVNLPAYQRVNTATDYDAGSQWPRYLKFNGTNQWLQTNSIDFTYGDKMFVSAGVRKLSDAAIGMIAETSVNTNVNNGAFFFSAPTTLGTGTYRWASRGTATAVSDTPNSYAAPITSITTCIGDISGDSAILRVNGTQAAISTTDQGTGNYGNYPLYLGARAGSSLWFNGRLYGMVIAGKQASAAEIASTETYINQKTGAF